MSSRSASHLALAGTLLACLCGIVRAQCDTYTIAPGPATWSPGTTDIGSHGDEEMTAVTPPFPISLYGSSYTSITVSSNGFIEFGGSAQNYVNDCLPTQMTSPIIFAFWDDLSTEGPDRGVYTAVNGAPGNREFVVEWRNVFSFDGSGSGLGFEVIFHEGQSAIDLVYQTVGLGESATIGIQGAASGPAAQFGCNTAVLSNDMSLRFSCIASSSPGACCTSSGACSISTFGACVAPASFHGIGSACGPSECPQPGACCAADNSCSAVIEVECGEGSSFHGPGVACGPATCAASSGCALYTVSSGPAQFISGSADIGNHSNDAMTAVTLPFPVSLYGMTYTSVHVSSNGFAEFGGMAQAQTAQCLPATLFTSPTVFAYWTDLRTDGAASGQGVFTGTDGPPGSRSFVIEWRANQSGDGPGVPVLDFEIVLHEAQTYFDIIYESAPFGITAATVGVQGPVGTAPVQYGCAQDGSQPGPGLSLRFQCTTPAGACCDPTTAACALVLSQADCAVPSTFVPGTTSCAPNPCPPPSNDHCASAIDLTALASTFTEIVYNSGADSDATDCGGLHHGVWYKYTAASPTVLTCSGIGLHQHMRFAAAAGCASLPHCEVPATVNVSVLAPISLRVESGQTLWVLVGGDTDALAPGASLSVRFDIRTALANDTCEGATDLTGQAFPYETVLDYNHASDDPAQCGRAIVGAWYSYTASQRCVLTCYASTVNFSSEGHWAFASGCATPARCVLERPFGLGDSAAVQLEAGETVKILAYDPTIYGGHVRSLEFNVLPTPADSSCSFQRGAAQFVPGIDDVTALGADRDQIDFPLPFPVTLYGVTHSRAMVHPYGFVAFGLVTPFPENLTLAQQQMLPTSEIPTTTIFPCWDQGFSTLGVVPGAGIFSRVLGPMGDRSFVIEWRQSRDEHDSAPTHVFEVVLYESRPYFDMIYQTLPDIISATIGVQASGTGPATVFECVPAEFLGPTSITGGTSLRVSCASVPLAMGACCDNRNYCAVTFQSQCPLATFAVGSSCLPSPCTDAALPNDVCASAINLNSVRIPFMQDVDTRLTTPDNVTGAFFIPGGVWYTFTASQAGTLNGTGTVPGMTDGEILFSPYLGGCAGVWSGWDVGGLGVNDWTYHMDAGMQLAVAVLPGRDAPYPSHFDVSFSFQYDCHADYNGNGVLEVQDIFDFLNAWFAGNPRADFNNSGVLQVQDIFDFLNAWFAGCH